MPDHLESPRPREFDDIRRRLERGANVSRDELLAVFETIAAFIGRLERGEWCRVSDHSQGVCECAEMVRVLRVTARPIPHAVAEVRRLGSGQLGEGDEQANQGEVVHVL